ncbi:MAG: hypothetical protein LBT10_01090 [Methanobrevibacter sp.]|jgi:hypothetical protein|nr:hypothetical protein [Methanobrevibacter sp.]
MKNNKYTDIITVIDIENAKTDKDISILAINGINNLATNHLNDIKTQIAILNERTLNTNKLIIGILITCILIPIITKYLP